MPSSSAPTVVIADAAGPSRKTLRERECEKSREACIAAFVADCNDEPDGDACNELVWRFVVAADPPLPEARRFALRCVADKRLCPARDACERNDAAGCLEYGRREQAYGPGVRNFKIITAAYRKSCTLGNAEGCRSVAFLYERGPEGMSDAIEANVPYDKKEAVRLYRLACTKGDAPACARLVELKK